MHARNVLKNKKNKKVYILKVLNTSNMAKLKGILNVNVGQKRHIALKKRALDEGKELRELLNEFIDKGLSDKK